MCVRSGVCDEAEPLGMGREVDVVKKRTTNQDCMRTMRCPAGIPLRGVVT